MKLLMSLMVLLVLLMVWVTATWGMVRLLKSSENSFEVLFYGTVLLTWITVNLATILTLCGVI